MTSRILILGAKGYVGARLLRRLADTDGLEAVGAGRSRPAGAPASFLTLDATDAEALRSALSTGFDAVVNCVGGPPAVIAGGARALAQALGSPGCAAHLIHFSSMAVYGSVRGEVDESCPLNGDVSAYARAKVQAEQALRGTRAATILRPGCIYGPGSPQWTERIGAWLRAGRIGDLGPLGDGCSNLVYIDDVCQAVQAALRAPAAGCRAYNLAMPDSPSWNLYFERYARHLGHVPLRRIGARRLRLETRLLAPALKIAELAGRRLGVRGLPAPLPPSLLRLWGQDIRLDSRRASQAWGLRWTPLEEGLRQCAAAASPPPGPFDGP
ncbi:NAD-dependent epimerase/dehydratase family protein [Castellaniella defragrans]|uniref:NAD-dependent epimerase/dehydratase family protein n=1 Tax=Castellaniella defragrans TaxID=75697 RepID=UPI002AFDDBA1|nr:NAD-dependent epimerase/dehydratase family protein [Castellaniella defragrans]